MAENNDPRKQGADTQRTLRRRNSNAQPVWRRDWRGQQMLSLAGGFLLLIFLVVTMIIPIVHPVFPLAALVFYLYPFRTAIVPRRTLQLGITAFMVWLFMSLSGVLFPFIVAFIVAYIFSPLVARFERKGVARWITSVGITLSMLGLYALVGVLIVPGVVAQFQDLFVSGQKLLKDANSFLDRAHLVSELQRLGIPREQASDLVTHELEPQLKQIVGWVINNLGAFIKNASGILEGVINLLLIPLLTLYLLIDFQRLRNFLRTKVLRENPRYVYYLREVDGILSAYLRGIMITSSIVGTLATIVLSAFGVKYAVILGIMTGVFNLIPSVGIFLNLGVAAIVFVFVPDEFVRNMLITTLTVFGLHTLNAYGIEPRVIGDRVGLRPVILIGSLFVFAHFLGFIGLLVAVPTSAVIAMFLREWYRSNVDDASQLPAPTVQTQAAADEPVPQSG